MYITIDVHAHQLINETMRSHDSKQNFENAQHADLNRHLSNRRQAAKLFATGVLHTCIRRHRGRPAHRVAATAGAPRRHATVSCSHASAATADVLLTTNGRRRRA